MAWRDPVRLENSSTSEIAPQITDAQGFCFLHVFLWVCKSDLLLPCNRFSFTCKVFRNVIGWPNCGHLLFKMGFHYHKMFAWRRSITETLQRNKSLTARWTVSGSSFSQFLISSSLSSPPVLSKEGMKHYLASWQIKKISLQRQLYQKYFPCLKLGKVSEMINRLEFLFLYKINEHFIGKSPQSITFSGWVVGIISKLSEKRSLSQHSLFLLSHTHCREKKSPRLWTSDIKSIKH